MRILSYWLLVGRERIAVRENPKGNKEIQESREMSEVVFMNPFQGTLETPLLE